MKKWNPTSPSYIFHNAAVHTVDEKDTIAQAAAVAESRILAVGDNESILALADKKTRVFDLESRSLIPGLIDAHCHPVSAGLYFQTLFIYGMSSIAELQAAVAEKVKDLPPGAWLEGGSWIESQYAEKRMPTRWDLDPVSLDHPVVLERVFSCCVANSKALEMAGLTRDTPDPEGGEIGRDSATGELNGLLHRTAKALIRKAMPTGDGAGEPSEKKEGSIQRSVRRAMEEFVRYGITGLVEAGVTPLTRRAYQNMFKNQELLLRVNLMPQWHGFNVVRNMEVQARLVEDSGFVTGFGNEWLRLGGLKMAIDGGLTSKTALKSWAYLGDDTTGDPSLLLDLDKLNGYVKKAHDAGWSVGIHVMGDIAMDRAVEAVYQAHQANPAPRRHQIIHAYYPTGESLAKIQAADMTVVLQPSFIYGEADGYPDLLPWDKQESFLPMRTYFDRGIRVISSSDVPSAHHNPFQGFYAAVTRKGMHGHQLGTKEAITVPEMLRTMTVNPAYLTEEDHIKGSIEPGKLADLAILDRNLLETPAENLKDIRVEKTMIDGRFVYERD